MSHGDFAVLSGKCKLLCYPVLCIFFASLSPASPGPHSICSLSIVHVSFLMQDVIVEGTWSSSSSSSDMSNELDNGSHGDEDMCPICLLEMLDGESMVECREGCHNRLHHHCLAICEQEIWMDGWLDLHTLA